MSQLSYAAMATGLRFHIWDWTKENFDGLVESLMKAGNSFEEKAYVEYFLRKCEHLLEFNEGVASSLAIEGGQEEMEFQLLRVKSLCVEILERPVSQNFFKLKYNGNVKSLVKLFYNLSKETNGKGEYLIDNKLNQIENFLVGSFELNRKTVIRYLENPSQLKNTKELSTQIKYKAKVSGKKSP